MVFQVDSYEKYVLECEEKEKAEMLDQIDDEKKSLEMSEKWKERRECLDMLKQELQRVREGKDMSDWDSLLDEELKKHADLDSDDIFGEKEEKEKEQEQEQEQDQEQDQKKKKKKTSPTNDQGNQGNGQGEKEDSKKEGSTVKVGTAEPKKQK